MPLPRAVARFQKSVTNRAARRIAGRVPGYGLLEHVGRTSGRTYTTPLNTFVTPGGFVVLLAYGSDTDWLRNLEAAGTAKLVHRGRAYELTDPTVVVGPPGLALLPRYGRALGRLTRTSEVLTVAAVPTDTSGPPDAPPQA